MLSQRFLNAPMTRWSKHPMTRSHQRLRHLILIFQPPRALEQVINPLRVSLGRSHFERFQIALRAQGVFRAVLKQVDCLLVPATPMVAPGIGQTEVAIGGQVEDVRIATTRLVRGINALGLPALSMPAGFTRGGLPIGMQLIGRPFGERELLRIGAAIEDATGHLSRRPEFAE